MKKSACSYLNNNILNVLQTKYRSVESTTINIRSNSICSIYSLSKKFSIYCTAQYSTLNECDAEKRKLLIESFPIADESTRRCDVNVSIRVCAMCTVWWKKVDPIRVRRPIKAHFNILLVLFFPLVTLNRTFSLAIAIYSMLSIRFNSSIQLDTGHTSSLSCVFRFSIRVRNSTRWNTHIGFDVNDKTQIALVSEYVVCNVLICT